MTAHRPDPPSRRRWIAPAVLTAACLAGMSALSVGYTAHAVGQSQRNWCETMNLLTAHPVPRPASPKADPSREQAYIYYEDFVNLRARLGCGP